MVSVRGEVVGEVAAVSGWVSVAEVREGRPEGLVRVSVEGRELSSLRSGEKASRRETSDLASFLDDTPKG